MKITTLDPLIITHKQTDIVALFESLGFTQQHHNEDFADRTSIRLKNEDGFHIDVVQNDALTQDMTLIRMNVDDFEEARELLLVHGFKEGQNVRESKSARSVGMIAPSGMIIGLVEHKKNHE